MNKLLLVGVTLIFAMPVAVTSASGQEIAGLHPSVRPAHAPAIAEFQKPKSWYDEALAGVTRPYPASLSFLVDQGAWFSPFLHPGMTGPYDIRGWHRPQDQSSSPN